MGKTICFLCKSELGRLSIKWSMKDLGSLGSDIPIGMTGDDKVCGNCKIKSDEQSKAGNARIKQEMKTHMDSLMQRSGEYKKQWDKNGVIQFKNDRIAILQRAVGRQVEFIVAYDDITRDGYRLMAIDEGKSAGNSDVTGGMNAYFYFQKISVIEGADISGTIVKENIPTNSAV